MRIVIPDDYQDIVRRLDCWQVLQGQEVTVHHDTVKGVEALAERFAQAEAIQIAVGYDRQMQWLANYYWIVETV